MTSLKYPVTFLTGGTGFLGSHIGAELLRRDSEVVFPVRHKGNLTGADRMKKILDWHGIPPDRRDGVRLIDGIPDTPLSGIGRIIHCMSDTSFSGRDRDRVWAANVDSLKEMIDFAVRSRIPRLIYISTAYAAGRREGVCPEEPIDSTDFHNVYEESKAAAENFLLRQCRETGIRLTIVRPSIVYGDSRTGRTLRFNAVYYPVKTALFLTRVFVEDIRKYGGKKAAGSGVSVEPDGRIRLPLRIESDDRFGINLIPVDFFIQALFALMEETSSWSIHHIVNPRQTGIADIIRYTMNQFNLTGIRSCGPDDFLKSPRNPMEELYDRYLQAYLPYLKDPRIFGTEKSFPILNKRGIICPEFDESMFRLCMSYAVASNWQSI